MRLKTFTTPIVAGALIFSSTAASAAGTVAGATGATAASACASAIGAGAAAAAQAVRPGCVLPAIDTPPPMVGESAVPVEGGSFIGGWALPLLGLAALAALFFALNGDDDAGGSLSRG